MIPIAKCDVVVWPVITIFPLQWIQTGTMVVIISVKHVAVESVIFNTCSLIIIMIINHLVNMIKKKTFTGNWILNIQKKWKKVSVFNICITYCYISGKWNYSEQLDLQYSVHKTAEDPISMKPIQNTWKSLMNYFHRMFVESAIERVW